MIHSSDGKTRFVPQGVTFLKKFILKQKIIKMSISPPIQESSPIVNLRSASPKLPLSHLPSPPSPAPRQLTFVPQGQTFADYISSHAQFKSVESNPESPRKKRKQSVPMRSICSSQLIDEQSKAGIVKLDVYSMFLSDPKKLLYTSESSKSRIKKMQKASKSSLNFFKTFSQKESPSEADADADSKKHLFRGQKALPEEIEEYRDIDLTRFKDTIGAPAVQWKGTLYSHDLFL